MGARSLTVIPGKVPRLVPMQCAMDTDAQHPDDTDQDDWAVTLRSSAARMRVGY